MSHDVFISYASHDKPTADAACAVLEANNIRCWIAPRDILPGKDWGEAIVDAIQDSRLFLLIFSSRANESSQIKREVERAVNRGIPVIPVRIEDVAPTRSLEYFISTPHWLDAFAPPLQNHLNYLVEVIGALLKGDSSVPPRAPLAPAFDTKAPLSAEAGMSRNALVWGAAAAALVLLAGVSAWALMTKDTRGVAPPPAGAVAQQTAKPKILDPKLTASITGKWTPDGLSCDQPLEFSVKQNALSIVWPGRSSSARISFDQSTDEVMSVHASDGDYKYLVQAQTMIVTDPNGNTMKMKKCAG